VFLPTNKQKMNWKTIDSRYISQHQYFTARVDTCEMPDGTIVPEYYVVELPISACALALTQNGEAIMVEQYRHPLGETITEIPGGFMDAGENPATAIARELLEETGYTFENIYEVGKVAANPGVLNNYTYLYLATGGVKAGNQQLDHHEEIKVNLVPLAAVKKMLANNQIAQALHTTCIFYALHKLDSLGHQ
jgi:8-oxo-dGTP pyrophosphatase MutT (NUDIX family)